MIWLWWLLCQAAPALPAPVVPIQTAGLQESAAEDALRELVYQAEVFGRNAQSLEALRSLLPGADPARRPRIIRAMAMVKASQPRPGDTGALLTDLQDPSAVITRQGMLYLLAGATWLEAGDWVGSYFLLSAEAGRVVLQNRDGFTEEIALTHPLNAPPGDNVCILRDAPGSTVLQFVVRRAELNNFSPSDLRRELTGTFPIVDWLSLMDRLCRELQLVWTRRRDNVIFSYIPQNTVTRTSVHETLNRRNQDLHSFFQWLTDSFDLELVTDVPYEELKAIRVDIYAQDQSWDETLDCLAVMNGFAWALIEDADKQKLLLTRDP